MAAKRGKGKNSCHANWKKDAFILVAAFLLLMLFSFIESSITGGVYYYDYGPPGVGAGYAGYGFGYQFSSIYYQYGYLVDAFVFLLIFLGAGKVVFGRQYGEHGKPLYIGLGLFLAFALLLWEERVGIRLLEVLGPFAVVLFFLLFFVALALALRRRLSGITTAILVILAFFLLMFVFKEFALPVYFGVLNFLYNLWYPLGAFVQGIVDANWDGFPISVPIIAAIFGFFIWAAWKGPLSPKKRRD